MATHCQRGEKSSVVGYIKSKGLAADTPNMTVSSFGGHPGVKGNGYVPYYMVFDHRGKLRQHHMCGAYHGGDGLAMIDWVHRLLDETPSIYLGEEPYTHLEDLAAKVASRSSLGAVAKKLEAEPTSDDARGAEVKRLHGALTAWRDRQLAHIERKLAKKPSEVLGALSKLAKELSGSTLAEKVTTRANQLKEGSTLKAAIALQKVLEKTQRKIDKLKVPKEAKRRGLKQFDPSDAQCRAAHKKTLERSAAKLREALEGHEDLPIAKTVRAYADVLDPAE